MDRRPFGDQQFVLLEHPLDFLGQVRRTRIDREGFPLNLGQTLARFGVLNRGQQPLVSLPHHASYGVVRFLQAPAHLPRLVLVEVQFEFLDVRDDRLPGQHRAHQITQTGHVVVVGSEGQLVPCQRPALQRRGRRVPYESETDPQKSFRLSLLIMPRKLLCTIPLALHPSLSSPTDSSEEPKKSIILAALVCPMGTYERLDERSNAVCVGTQTGEVRRTEGTLTRCPTGMVPRLTPGGAACVDPRTGRAVYDIRRECPNGTARVLTVEGEVCE